MSPWWFGQTSGPAPGGCLFCANLIHLATNGIQFAAVFCPFFSVLLVEGKDKPRQMPGGKFNHLGKTPALLLTLCESLFSLGTEVILDSGFCVLAALIELHKMGVFVAAVIKKRHYWPKYILGDHICNMMSAKEIGTTDSLKGKVFHTVN